MRIALVSFEMTTSGGGQRQLLQLAIELRELGHDVTLHAYQYNPAGCHPALSSQVEIRCIEQFAAEQLPDRTSSFRILANAARRYFIESRALARRIEAADIINGHDRPGHRAAVFAKRLTGSPVVWTCNDVVSWEKTGHRARMPAYMQAAASHLMRPLERHIANEIDRIAVLDRSTQQVVERAYGRLTTVVRSGLDTQALTFRTEGRRRIRDRYGIADGTFTVMWLGILEPFRRLEDLLEAVRLRRETGATPRVLITGRVDIAPRYARELRDFVTRHNLDPLVQFIAHSIPEDELADYYSACDVFVFPNDHQAWGLAPLEALACQRPVIVSRGSGVHEVLVDGDTALLVAPRDPGAIAEALRSLMENPVLAGRIAHQGREFVAREFSWRGYAMRMVKLYEETIEATNRLAEPSRATSSRLRGSERRAVRSAEPAEPPR